ncbi:MULTISPECIES: cupin domain-containing protein [Bacillaceae]|nr:MULTISPECIES: cupin domain-containing protein [Bacillaceae]
MGVEKMSRAETKDNYTYLSQKPGLQLIKVGSYDMKELNTILGIPEVKSQILDVPVTANDNAATLGLYAMQEATKGFDFKYDFLEIKTVVTGKFVLSDDQGNSFTAEAGDVVIINPGTTVTFHGESDGTAIYVAHRLPEPTFA